MNADPSGDLAKLIKSAIAEQLASMAVAQPCKVISFDEPSGIAVVQPLMQLTDEPTSPIQTVPVLGHKYRTESGIIKRERHILEPGDTVYIVCADRQIKDAMKGQFGKPTSLRSHDKNDAVIVGVFPCSL
ncbi:hypothetical protein [Brevibacillus brevis]|uniref:hypothetical protein n=1 Tax=Brevibacillus brevis TaxID=1393 RepID=UPI001159455C|nr:hypothetical protein [Lysinibacillus sp. SDF0063]TQR29385.1 hypothetical protein C7Y45_28725 [Lysinibacillus sp. SDF0063]